MRRFDFASEVVAALLYAGAKGLHVCQPKRLLLRWVLAHKYLLDIVVLRQEGFGVDLDLEKMALALLGLVVRKL